MLNAIFAVALLTTSPDFVATPDLSDCVMSHMSDADKTEIAAAFHHAREVGVDRSSDTVVPLIEAKVVSLAPAFAQCDATPGLPPKLWKSAIDAAVVEYGVAGELQASRAITRTRLDAAWQAAPDGIRRCEYASAGKLFDIKLSCDVDGPINWYTTNLGIDGNTQADYQDAGFVGMYMYTKAKGKLVSSMIATFEKTHPAKP